MPTNKENLETYKAAVATHLAGLTIQESTSFVDYDGHRISCLREIEMANALIAFEDEPYEVVTELFRG